MTSYGFTMIVRGVPEDYEGIQLLEQRMLSWIDPNLPDDQIMSKLANDVFTDFAFSKPLTLKGILDDCIKYRIIPIINLCITEGTWKDHARLSPSECAKIGGILRDYLKGRGFVKRTAYITCFNEPNTDGGLSTSEACPYWNELHDKVGSDFDVIYGNDEMGNLDWDYLGKNCRAKVMGTHFLSCLGSWENPKKNWYLIRDAKTIANLYKKKLIGDECGCWFKDYCKEGHQINLDIMAECKKYDIDCLIVLPDVNKETKKEWKLLGYRIFNNDFTEQVGGCSSKFNELMDYIKLNGTVPDIPIERNDGMIIKTIGHKPTDVRSGYGCLLLNETLNFLDYLDDDYVNFEYTDKTKTALEKWQTDIKPLYNNSIDGRCGRMTWRYFKKEVKKIDIDAYNDLKDDMDVIFSPYNVKGDT